ncbi:17896_t:CDS:2 [Acaulospora morrowiae]|uniref:17896_t:CDS:1 n=1 Tax=Acaulospora morrowiae TaxID=94023 RepID=A0A9N9D229_9GLOM|nr:17896_t:CDS:2 [Acaulospora morrowiae]
MIFNTKFSWGKLLFFVFIVGGILVLMLFLRDSVFCMDLDLQGRPRAWHITAIYEVVNGHNVILIADEHSITQALGCTAEQAHQALYGGAEINGWELEYQFVPQQVWDQVLRTHPEITSRASYTLWGVERSTPDPCVPLETWYHLFSVGARGPTQLDDPIARHPKVYVKLFFELAQKSSADTLHMFGLFSQVLNDYFQVSLSSKGVGMTALSVSGARVATHVIPFLSQFTNYLYWKTPQFELTSEVTQIVLNKGHLTKEGLLKIVHLLYSSPVNSRKEPIEHWIKLIEEAFPAGSKPRRGTTK